MRNCRLHRLDATTFIQFNCWDGGNQGLLSGEGLHLDVKRMEVAYHDNNKRELELTRHISLRQLDPLALLALRSVAQCTFTIPAMAIRPRMPRSLYATHQECRHHLAAGRRAVLQGQLHNHCKAVAYAFRRKSMRNRRNMRVRVQTTHGSSTISALPIRSSPVARTTIAGCSKPTCATLLQPAWVMVK